MGGGWFRASSTQPPSWSERLRRHARPLSSSRPYCQGRFTGARYAINSHGGIGCDRHFRQWLSIHHLADISDLSYGLDLDRVRCPATRAFSRVARGRRPSIPFRAIDLEPPEQPRRQRRRSYHGSHLSRGGTHALGREQEGFGWGNELRRASASAALEVKRTRRSPVLASVPCNTYTVGEKEDVDG
jgi:hypothetical protein